MMNTVTGITMTLLILYLLSVVHIHGTLESECASAFVIHGGLPNRSQQKHSFPRRVQSHDHPS